MFLITGSSGMIGTALCESLLKDGKGIVGVDKRRNGWNDAVQKGTVIWDLQKPLNALGKDVEAIIHLAANARVWELVKNPGMAFENMQSTYNTLEYARTHGIKQVFFSSSREVYGNIGTGMIKEGLADFTNCESPYAASKILGEALIESYKVCYGIDYLIFRLSNVYGKYDVSDRIIPLFVKKAMANEDLVVYGGDKVLDFTYIDDAVMMIRNGMDNFSKVKNKVYNVGTGKGTGLVELANAIKQKTGSKSNIIIEKERPGEVTKYIADVTRLREAFGVWPAIGIDKGLEASVPWLMAEYSKNK